MKHKYIKIEPPSRRYRVEDVVYIRLDDCPIGGIALEDRLLTGESFDLETLFSERVAEARLEDYGDVEEAALEAINEEVGGEIVELINLLIHSQGGMKFSEDSVFSLTEERETLDG